MKGFLSCLIRLVVALAPLAQFDRQSGMAFKFR